MTSRPGWVPGAYLSVLSSRSPNRFARASVAVCSGLMNSACSSTSWPSSKNPRRVLIRPPGTVFHS